jgi:hypothetical protein
MDHLFRGGTAFLVLPLALLSPGSLSGGDDAGVLIATIKAVGKEGAGNPGAATASRALVQLGPNALPAIVARFDDDNPIVTNWLRAAADAIGEQAQRDKKPLPKRALETFVLDTTNPAGGRYVAYQWLVRADPSASTRLLPAFLHDRSADLRRASVETRFDTAKKLLAQGDRTAAIAVLREALSGACDRDQVDSIADKLKEQGIVVDLAALFGFIRTWHVIGPFDNANGTKIAVAYPPENGVNLKTMCKGKGDVACRWEPFTTDHPYGKVDFNKAIGRKKGVIAYAWTALESPVDRPAEIRVGSATAVKVFHNGKEVLNNDEYFHGIPEMDQFVIPIKLRAGPNEILIKVGQNEETGSWTEQWWFQARLCDSTGVALHLNAAAKVAARPTGGS